MNYSYGTYDDSSSSSGDGWLDFANMAFSTAAKEVPALVLSGQQNKTDREETIAIAQSNAKVKTALIYGISGFAALVLIFFLVTRFHN